MPKKLPQRPASRAGLALPGTVRVALYLHISTDERNQPYSMAAQDHALRTFIESQPGWEYAATYRDEASGTLGPDGRSGLADLLADGKAGRFDLVLVQRVDRMARQISLLRDLIGQLTEAGVAFRSATQMFDTSKSVRARSFRFFRFGDRLRACRQCPPEPLMSAP